MKNFGLFVVWLGVLHHVQPYFSAHVCQSTSKLDSGCNVCNNELGFSNSGKNDCLENVSDYCTRFDELGYCVRCSSNLTPVGATCRPLSPSNCVAFATESLCRLCPAGFYPAGSVCLSVPNPAPIGNCSVYSAANTCVYCAAGYQLVGQACVALPANCVYFRNFQCQSCQNGYSLIADDQLASQELQLVYALYANQLSIPIKPQVCVPNGVENCAVFSNSDTCGKCLAGFALVDGRCVTGAISNCDVYQNESTCLVCANGFYSTGAACLANPTQATNDAFCLYYSSVTTCGRCLADYYPNPQGKCV